MEYRQIGKTKIKASILGFGAMRLPMDISNGKNIIKEDESIDAILKSFELGINIIDTAYPYCYHQSEKVVGKALKIWKKYHKDSVIYLSTKFPTWLAIKKSDFRNYLEKQLDILDMDSIDFYHFHSLNDEYFEDKVLKLNLISESNKAKDEGLIKHTAFSFHDVPEVLKKIIDTGFFEAVLCQYNILDRTNEEAIAYAKQKGLGVFIMGPLGGGRVKIFEFFKNIFVDDISKIHELALRFVLSNPDISVAFSGMESIKMVEENIETANKSLKLTEAEIKIIEKFTKQKKIGKLIPCTNCQYCLPCPNDVVIPKILKIMNYNTLTGLIGNSSWQYKNITLDGISKQADACSECGECEEKCPQDIDIIRLIKEAHKIFIV